MNRTWIGKLIAASFAALCTASAWAVTPVNADFQTILDGRLTQTGVWRYADNPKIFVFDFPGLALQGRTFNRVTQLSEQQISEPYPRVLTTDELTKYIDALRRTQADFAFGHDILVTELVQFFNLALRDKVDLYPEEIALREFLVEQGLIREWRGFYQAMEPGAVVLSIPQPQEKQAAEPRITVGARTAILLHEMAHGEYYTSPYYSAYCKRFWSETLTDNQREAFKKFLSKYNYSVAGEDLLVNEMQAYLMFTPDQASFSARKLGVGDAELAAMREAFRKGKPPTKLPLNF